MLKSIIKMIKDGKSWLIPPLIVIALTLIVIAIGGNPAVAPFLYTLF